MEMHFNTPTQRRRIVMPVGDRQTSLLHITYKLLSKALLNWLEEHVDHQINEY